MHTDPKPTLKVTGFPLAPPTAATVKLSPDFAVGGGGVVNLMVWLTVLLGWSTTSIVSGALTGTVVCGGNPGAELAPEPFSASVCVYVEPEPVLVRLLNGELSVNVIVPFAGAPVGAV